MIQSLLGEWVFLRLWEVHLETSILFCQILNLPLWCSIGDPNTHMPWMESTVDVFKKEFSFCTKVSENAQTVSQGNSWYFTQYEFSKSRKEYTPVQDSMDLWIMTISMYMIVSTKLCLEEVSCILRCWALSEITVAHVFSSICKVDRNDYLWKFVKLVTADSTISRFCLIYARLDTCTKQQ